MAGVTDKPFRRICAEFGAGLTVSEMASALEHLQRHPRTQKKTELNPAALESVQIIGADPRQMALAARMHADRGAAIIDINMGCPAKKVCQVAAGSALLRDEKLVADILAAVVSAVSVPVTLKIRTGWDLANRNAVSILRIAEQNGVQMLTVHGRSRACKFEGQAEYDTIRQVKQAARIPIIANGDIDSPEKAMAVLKYTGADGLMIGRAAQGRPWLFREMLCKMRGLPYAAPGLTEIQEVINRHLESLYEFYGAVTGVRMARKHLNWYWQRLGGLPADVKAAINQAEQPGRQLALVNATLDSFPFN